MKKLLGILFISFLLNGCATYFDDYSTYEEFVAHAHKNGFKYCAKAQNPRQILYLHKGKKSFTPACNGGQQAIANKNALEQCGINCVIVMENYTLTSEGKRLTKEANLKFEINACKFNCLKI